MLFPHSFLIERTHSFIYSFFFASSPPSPLRPCHVNHEPLLLYRANRGEIDSHSISSTLSPSPLTPPQPILRRGVRACVYLFIRYVVGEGEGNVCKEVVFSIMRMLCEKLNEAVHTHIFSRKHKRNQADSDMLHGSAHMPRHFYYGCFLFCRPK